MNRLTLTICFVLFLISSCKLKEIKEEYEASKFLMEAVKNARQNSNEEFIQPKFKLGAKGLETVVDLSNQNKDELAIEKVNRIISKNPKLISPLLVRALILKKAKLYNESLKDVQKSYELVQPYITGEYKHEGIVVSYYMDDDNLPDIGNKIMPIIRELGVLNCKIGNLEVSKGYINQVKNILSYISDPDVIFCNSLILINEGNLQDGCSYLEILVIEGFYPKTILKQYGCA